MSQNDSNKTILKCFPKKILSWISLEKKLLPWDPLQPFFVLGIRCLFFPPFKLIYYLQRDENFSFTFPLFFLQRVLFPSPFTEVNLFFLRFVLLEKPLRCVSARKREVGIRCSVDEMDRFALITYGLELKSSSLGSHSLDTSMSGNLNSIFVLPNYWRMNNAEADGL